MPPGRYRLEVEEGGRRIAPERAVLGEDLPPLIVANHTEMLAEPLHVLYIAIHNRCSDWSGNA
mgnify:CR=1 FL=1